MEFAQNMSFKGNFINLLVNYYKMNIWGLVSENKYKIVDHLKKYKLSRESQIC